MRSRSYLALACVVSLPALVLGQTATSHDWPQWRGLQRDGVSKEVGLLQTWPAAGPAQVWSATGLGQGYGSVAVGGDRIFVLGLRGSQTVLHSVNRLTGDYVWSKNLGAGGRNDRGPGPRSTPTIDGDRVYALTETGTLACLKVADGAMVWQRQVLRDFRGDNISWLLSESPLVDGDRVIVTPGGRGASMVALDKMTGKTLWASSELSDRAGYASAVVAEVGGVRAYTTVTESAAVGVRASDGKLLWRSRQAANSTANNTTPVVQGSRVFYTTGYGVGALLMTLVAQSGDLRADEVYASRDMQNHHGGVVVVNGTVYGFSNSILVAIDLATGRFLWRDRSVGKGAVIHADNRLYILGEDNVVGLAEVTPKGYRETGRFRIRDEGLPSWAHPVVSNGRLYIRNQGTLTAYEVSAR